MFLTKEVVRIDSGNHNLRWHVSKLQWKHNSIPQANDQTSYLLEFKVYFLYLVTYGM